MQSIFTDLGKLSLQDPAHSATIPGSGHAGGPSTSTAWLSHQGEAHFALACPAGGIMVVTLPPHDTQGKESVPGVRHPLVLSPPSDPAFVKVLFHAPPLPVPEQANGSSALRWTGSQLLVASGFGSWT